jgi:hypothetical protein
MNILLYSSIPTNIVTYIRERYIPRFLHQLTEKCNLRSSVIEVCSSVITDEHILVFYSAMLPSSVVPPNDNMEAATIAFFHHLSWRLLPRADLPTTPSWFGWNIPPPPSWWVVGLDGCSSGGAVEKSRGGVVTIGCVAARVTYGEPCEGEVSYLCHFSISLVILYNK